MWEGEQGNGRAAARLAVAAAAVGLGRAMIGGHLHVRSRLPYATQREWAVRGPHPGRPLAGCNSGALSRRKQAARNILEVE